MQSRTLSNIFIRGIILNTWHKNYTFQLLILYTQIVADSKYALESISTCIFIINGSKKCFMDQSICMNYPTHLFFLHMFDVNHLLIESIVRILQKTLVPF